MWGSHKYGMCFEGAKGRSEAFILKHAHAEDTSHATGRPPLLMVHQMPSHSLGGRAGCPPLFLHLLLRLEKEERKRTVVGCQAWQPSQLVSQIGLTVMVMLWARTRLQMRQKESEITILATAKMHTPETRGVKWHAVSKGVTGEDAGKHLQKQRALNDRLARGSQEANWLVDSKQPVKSLLSG